MKRFYTIVQSLLIIFLISTSYIHTVDYSFKPAIRPTSQFKTMQMQATSQLQAGVSLQQQIINVDNQIKAKQAELTVEQQKCSQVSAFEQAFAESCQNVEIINQDLRDLSDLMVSLQKQVK